MLENLSATDLAESFWQRTAELGALEEQLAGGPASAPAPQGIAAPRERSAISGLLIRLSSRRSLRRPPWRCGWSLKDPICWQSEAQGNHLKTSGTQPG